MREIFKAKSSLQRKLGRITDLRLSVQGDLEVPGCGQRAGIEEWEKEHKRRGRARTGSFLGAKMRRL